MSIYQTHRKNVTSIADVTFNENNVEMLSGAQRGILMLQMTYNLDVAGFAKGDLGSYDVSCNLKRKIDRLTVADLTTLGKTAFLLNWYDTAVIFFKESFHGAKENDRVSTSKQFEENLGYLKELGLLLSTYHNHVLLKNKVSLGVNWKTFSFPIDPGKICHFVGYNCNITAI